MDFFTGGNITISVADYLCITVMFLSAVLPLILTAPIHCH